MKLLQLLLLGMAVTLLGTIPYPNPITHVVIIDQENRTPDQLFNDAVCSSPDAPSGNCLANYSIAQYGQVGKHLIQLQPTDLCSSTPCNCHTGATCNNCPTIGECPSAANYDPSHKHGAWESEYNNGRMNGWNINNITNVGNCTITYCVMTYTLFNQIEPYVTMATTYATNDNFFQDNQGPSFPSHQYVISGTSACGKLCTPTNPGGSSGQNHPTPPPTQSQYATYKAANNIGGAGCDASGGSLVDMIDQYGTLWPSLLFPCFDRQTLPDLLMAGGLTWQYYQGGGGGGLWNAPDAVWHLWNNPSFNTTWVDTNPTDFINNVCTNHTLASVTWVTPTNLSSDHVTQTDGSGPDWVSSVVNAIGYNGTVTTSASNDQAGNPHSYSCNGAFWNSTAIFVIWDDWGGWFDHVAPYIFNSYEKGFRVPEITISAYTSSGQVDHTFTSTGSIFKFIEEVFNLGTSLGNIDNGANDMSQVFNFSMTARSFNKITMIDRYVGQSDAAERARIRAINREPHDY